MEKNNEPNVTLLNLSTFGVIFAHFHMNHIFFSLHFVEGVNERTNE